MNNELRDLEMKFRIQLVDFYGESIDLLISLVEHLLDDKEDNNLETNTMRFIYSDRDDDFEYEGGFYQFSSTEEFVEFMLNRKNGEVFYDEEERKDF